VGMPNLHRVLVLVLTALVLAPAALAQVPPKPAAVQRVVSPGGIEAWFLPDRSLPILAVALSFPGGTAQDRAGKEGATDLMAQVMTEGAGDLDAEAFRARLEDLATSLSVSAGRDSLTVSFKTLTRYREEGAGAVAPGAGPAALRCRRARPCQGAATVRAGALGHRARRDRPRPVVAGGVPPTTRMVAPATAPRPASPPSAGTTSPPPGAPRSPARA
jgi:hypothetical protein